MKTGIKEKDAIHVASGLVANSDCFLTTDIRLLKYKTDQIVIEDPLDFLQRLDSSLNE